MKIGVVVHRDKPLAVQTLPVLLSALDALGIEHMLEFDPDAPKDSAARDVYTGDFVAVLGGDGTLLSCAPRAAERNIPLISINTGRLGFLSEIYPNEADIREGFAALLEGKYILDQRMMLSVRGGGKTHTALNDVVVSRAAQVQAIQLDVYVNGERVDRYIGDGVVISSPTGSTAYSLSAGGPIVSPTMECMIISPICPHTLRARPCVVPGDAEVRVSLIRGRENALVTCDGEWGISMDADIFVRRADMRACFVRLKDWNFYDLLHRKLSHWSCYEE